jgi:two-component system sensor histidine kinase CiaH
MLLASQIEAGGYSITKEEVDLSDVVRNCVHDFTIRFPQRQLQDNVANEVYIEGDFLLLQMAINNLIDNAIKYSPKETAITVSLFPEGKQIKLSVKDEGKGIEDSEKKKVFDKFYRVGNTATKGAKGTGLGLYLTKKIAQQHKANISVTDNNPTGSNFTISFKNEGSNRS